MGWRGGPPPEEPSEQQQQHASRVEECQHLSITSSVLSATSPSPGHTHSAVSHAVTGRSRHWRWQGGGDAMNGEGGGGLDRLLLRAFFALFPDSDIVDMHCRPLRCGAPLSLRSSLKMVCDSCVKTPRTSTEEGCD